MSLEHETNLATYDNKDLNIAIRSSNTKGRNKDRTKIVNLKWLAINVSNAPINYLKDQMVLPEKDNRKMDRTLLMMSKAGFEITDIKKNNERHLDENMDIEVKNVLNEDDYVADYMKKIEKVFNTDKLLINKENKNQFYLIKPWNMRAVYKNFKLAAYRLISVVALILQIQWPAVFHQRLLVHLNNIELPAVECEEVEGKLATLVRNLLTDFYNKKLWLEKNYKESYPKDGAYNEPDEFLFEKLFNEDSDEVLYSNRLKGRIRPLTREEGKDLAEFCKERSRARYLEVMKFLNDPAVENFLRKINYKTLTNYLVNMLMKDLELARLNLNRISFDLVKNKLGDFINKAAISLTTVDSSNRSTSHWLLNMNLIDQELQKEDSLNSTADYSSINNVMAFYYKHLVKNSKIENTFLNLLLDQFVMVMDEKIKMFAATDEDVLNYKMKYKDTDMNTYEVRAPWNIALYVTRPDVTTLIKLKEEERLLGKELINFFCEELIGTDENQDVKEIKMQEEWNDKNLLSQEETKNEYLKNLIRNNVDRNVSKMEIEELNNQKYNEMLLVNKIQTSNYHGSRLFFYLFDFNHRLKEKIGKIPEPSYRYRKNIGFLPLVIIDEFF
jgi:hypothetical protein